MPEKQVDGPQPPPTPEEEVEARQPYNDWVISHEPSVEEGQDHTKEG